MTTPFYFPSHDAAGKPWLRKGNCMVHFPRLAANGASVFVQALDPGEDTPTNILFDIGAEGSTAYVVDYLKGLGVEHLDLLVITHPHDDHMGYNGGGTPAIFNAFDVKQVWSSGHPVPLWYDGTTPCPDYPASIETYEEMLDFLFPDGYTLGDEGDVPGIVGASIIPYHEPRCETGPAVFNFGNLQLRVLNPGNTLTTVNLNNDSIVTQIRWGDTRFLVCGDLEEVGDAAVLAKVTSEVLTADDLKADVLQVGHHANNASVSAAFLAAVNPTWAVFQNGSIGHNIEQMEVAKIDATGAEVINAWGEAKDVVFVSDGYSVKRLQ
jgi:competence protein ComEC